MSFVLGQKSEPDKEDASGYMSYITAARPEQKKTRPDTTDQDLKWLIFENPCLVLNTGNFMTNIVYYLHVKIRRDENPMSFGIKLMHQDSKEQKETDNNYQFLKTISIAAADDTTNPLPEYDLEFLFVPLNSDFNAILFELDRDITLDGNRDKGYRKPKIAYVELSQVNNQIGTGGFTEGNPIIKLGVQSRPRFLMCINGEEIRTGLSGVYELKNNGLSINFFSIASGAAEVNTDPTDPNSLAHQQNDENAECKSFLGSSKKRPMSAFVVDYIYEKKS